MQGNVRRSLDHIVLVPRLVEHTNGEGGHSAQNDTSEPPEDLDRPRDLIATNSKIIIINKLKVTIINKLKVFSKLKNNNW